MEQIIGIDNNILVKWTLLRNDGSPFPIDRYTSRLWVKTPRGRNEIRSFSITGVDSNIVSWEMNNAQLRFIGGASLAMSILRKGLQIASVEYRDAFRISHRSNRSCDCVQVINLSSFVNILHPEEVPNAINVLFPTFEVELPSLHLHMKGTTEAYNSNFELDESGHLVFTND